MADETTTEPIDASGSGVNTTPEAPKGPSTGMIVLAGVILAVAVTALMSIGGKDPEKKTAISGTPSDALPGSGNPGSARPSTSPTTDASATNSPTPSPAISGASGDVAGATQGPRVIHRFEGFRPWHTDEDIMSMAITPNGETLMVGTESGFSAWDVATGKQRYEIETGGSVYIAISPDGSRAAVSEEGGQGEGSFLRLINVKDGGEVRAFQSRHYNPISCLAFSRNGKHVLSGGTDAAAFLWDVDLSASVLNFVTDEDEVTAVALSPDGQHAVIATTGDHGIRAYSTTSGELQHVFTKAHNGPIHGLAFTLDGRAMVSASEDQEVKVWDFEARVVTDVFEAEMPLKSLVLADAAGVAVLVGGDGGELRLWNRLTGEAVEFAHQSDEPGDILTIALTPDGRTAFTAGESAPIMCWDMATGTLRKTPTSAGHSARVKGIALTHDGRRAVSASADGTLKVWSLESRNLERTITVDAKGVNDLAVTGDGKRVMCAGESGGVTVWSLENGERLQVCESGKARPLAIAVDSDGRMIAASDAKGDVSVWVAETGVLKHAFAASEAPVRSISISPDGALVAAAGEDAIIRLWSLSSGEPVRSIESGQKDIYSLAFSPDGARLATVGESNTAKLWTVADGTESAALPFLGAALYTTAFSGDGKLLLAGGLDGKLFIWDVSTREKPIELSQAESQVGSVMCVTSSADGRQLLVGGDNGTITWWSLGR